MTSRNPARTGAAFAATVAVGYGLCSLVFWAWPDAAANFMNALFHGLDFRKLQSGTALFSFGSFLYAEAILAAWAFGLGALFGWLATRFHALGTERSTSEAACCAVEPRTARSSY
jgi:hypothetical protein